MNIAAVDIAAPALSSEPRPSKRRFAEIDDEGGEAPDSDELYDWVEDDEVAAEGLLIDEVPTTAAATDPAPSGATGLAESANDAEQSNTNLADMQVT